MLAQVALRIVRLARANGRDDQFVMAHDVLCFSWRGEMKPAQPVDMAAAAAHQIPKLLVAGCGIELLVEVRCRQP